MKLNMGCGLNKIKDFLNVDSDPSVCPDMIANITDALPWKDNSIDYIYSRFFWEHVGDKFISMIQEWYRISKSGIIWHIIVPNVDQHGAFQDPTHKRFFCIESFDYFDLAHDRWKNFGRRYGIPGFRIRSKSLTQKGRYISCQLEVIK